MTANTHSFFFFVRSCSVWRVFALISSFTHWLKTLYSSNRIAVRRGFLVFNIKELARAQFILFHLLFTIHNNFRRDKRWSRKKKQKEKSGFNHFFRLLFYIIIVYIWLNEEFVVAYRLWSQIGCTSVIFCIFFLTHAYKTTLSHRIH